MSDARDLLLSLAAASRADREAGVLAARDLWVDWPLSDVRILAPGHELVIRVTSDVFAVGMVDEPIRVPLGAPSCQKVADELGLVLITEAISDSIWRAADVQLQPITMAPDPKAMLSVDYLLRHNDAIEQHRAGKGGLIAGHKKDVVMSNMLTQRPPPARVVIYGWHTLVPMTLGAGPNVRHLKKGDAIQMLSAAHESTYDDYSHGLRLAAAEALLDGSPVQLADVMQDPDLCHLVSKEGPLHVLRYPE